MKYLIFTNVTSGQATPVLFPDNITHSEIKVAGCIATSGGFVNMTLFEPCYASESLGLKPAKGDTELIQLAMTDTFGSMWALVQDVEANKERLKDFCIPCGHLRVAHRFSGADDICRCAVIGCNCEGYELPKKSSK